MRRTSVLAGAGMVALLALAALPALRRDHAPHSPSAHSPADAVQLTCAARWAEGFELHGSVGGRESQAYFDMAPVFDSPEQVSGIVLFPTERMGIVLADAPIGLAGPPGADGCSVELTERETGTDGAVWLLHLESRTQVTGHRRWHDGRTDPVLFTIVPRTSCEGAGEWRTFSSRDWPIAFEYPADWVVTASRDHIAIECPSVTDLAYGGWWLSFEQGQFAPSSRPQDVRSMSGDDGAFTEPFWFSRRAGDDWRIRTSTCSRPSSESDDADCPPARRSERNGLRVLQGAAGEHRLYRSGVGYLGPGGGITRYLFIAGDRWVSLDIAGASSHHDAIGSGGGPVLLHGDGVGDRLVRSIRRR